MKRHLYLLGLIVVANIFNACSGRNSSSRTTPEIFVAVELQVSNGTLSEDNQLLYSIVDGEIVPSFRLGSNYFPMLISPRFGAPRAESFYGFAELPDEKIGFWSQKDGLNQINSIDKKTGEKTRLFSSKDQVYEIKYFKKQEVFVVNTGESYSSDSEGKCYVVAVNSEPQRVGTGRCESTKDRLWLITTAEDGTTLSELNSKFEVSGRQFLPSQKITLSHSGKLVIGESSKSGQLDVYSLSTGDKLWSSSETDLAAELLAVAESSDSFIIGIDADDEDGLVDLVWFRLDSDKLVTELLGSANSASVSLSQLGDFVVAELRGVGDVPPSLLTATFDGEIKVFDQGVKSEFTAFIEPNIVAFVEDQVLYLSIGGGTAARAMDVYGEIISIGRSAGGSILVTTSDDDEYLFTSVVQDGSRWRSDEIFVGAGRPSVLDARGDSVLIKSSEDDGYATLYSLDLSGEPKSEKLAEGTIEVANFGPDGQVYFVEVNGDSIDVYSVKPGDRSSRTRVSSRYTVYRYGQFGLKKARWIVDEPMISAVTDRLLAYCKAKGLPILLADSGVATLETGELSEFTDSQINVPLSAQACVRIRSKDSGKEISISATSTEDVAITWEEFDISDGEQPSVSSKMRTESADDQASTTNPFLRIETTDRSAIISVLSWDKKAPVEIAVGSQALIGSSSSELDFQRYNNHNLVKNECSKHAMIDGTKTLRVKVGVYPSGQTGVTPFCVRLSGFQDQARRLVMNPIETGDLAGLTVACTDGQYYFDKDFRSDRPSSEDYQNGYSFSATLKGLIGLCQFRHYEEYPASNRWGTWGEVELSLQK